MHIFTHREFAYHYVDKGPSDWMTRYFFSGGQMPSDDLLLYFQDDLVIEQHWSVSGTHYQKTAEAWLMNMDAHREDILPLFAELMAPENRETGGPTGESSSWPARNSGATGKGRNGSSRIIVFPNDMKSLPSRLLLPGALLLSGCAQLTPPPHGEAIKRDLVYVHRSTGDLHLDLYLPAQPAPHTLVIWIHGGGWK